MTPPVLGKGAAYRDMAVIDETVGLHEHIATHVGHKDRPCDSQTFPVQEVGNRAQVFYLFGPRSLMGTNGKQTCGAYVLSCWRSGRSGGDKEVAPIESTGGKVFPGKEKTGGKSRVSCLGPVFFLEVGAGKTHSLGCVQSIERVGELPVSLFECA